MSGSANELIGLKLMISRTELPNSDLSRNLYVDGAMKRFAHELMNDDQCEQGFLQLIVIERFWTHGDTFFSLGDSSITRSN